MRRVRIDRKGRKGDNATYRRPLPVFLLSFGIVGVQDSIKTFHPLGVVTWGCTWAHLPIHWGTMFHSLGLDYPFTWAYLSIHLGTFPPWPGLDLSPSTMALEPQAYEQAFLVRPLFPPHPSSLHLTLHNPPTEYIQPSPNPFPPPGEAPTGVQAE